MKVIFLWLQSELLKKQKSCSKRDSPPTWAKNCTGPDGSADYEHPVNKNLMTDYRLAMLRR